ncbi:MAG: hypothetical protein SVO01_06295, partial [Thermotogota bacterium]|nr:hypothetical protein [Thermotogota bacterium]
PEDLAKLMDRAIAYEIVSDKYTRRPFGLRKAIKLAVKMNALKRKFWKRVYELYPELKGKNLRYSLHKQNVEIMEEGEK